MPEKNNKDSSHFQILKSTGIIGGSKVLTIIIGIIRTKVIAILLGPAGVGIIGLYNSTLQMISSTTGMGLGFSAVRDVAKASGTQDHQGISKTIIVLYRWFWFSGIMGMILTIVFARPLSILTFGDPSYTWGIRLVSGTILFTALYKGQIAILQGLRKIQQIAFASILGAFVSLLITVPLYYFYGVKGIVPAILLTAASSLFFSWWYTRKIRVEKIRVPLKETFYMGMDMLKLGLFTVVAGFITTATMYLVRIFISQKMNIDAVGIFQAAWTLSTLYIGLVLDAMATDYFPRLSAVNQDNSSLKKLVNEQTEVALVIAIPLITGMLVFLPFIVRLFYSAKFEAAIPILDWQLLGVFLRLIGWPMGFVILAKAKGKIFVFTQFFWNLLFGGFIFFGWRSFQLEITGIAFFLAYLLGVPLNFFILKKIIGFHWTNKTVQMMIFSSLFVFGAFLTIRLLPSPYHYIVGSTIFLGSLLYSYLALRKMVVIKSIFQSIFRGK